MSVIFVKVFTERLIVLSERLQNLRGNSLSSVFSLHLLVSFTRTDPHHYKQEVTLTLHFGDAPLNRF